MYPSRYLPVVGSLHRQNSQFRAPCQHVGHRRVSPACVVRQRSRPPSPDTIPLSHPTCLSFATYRDKPSCGVRRGASICARASPSRFAHQHCAVKQRMVSPPDRGASTTLLHNRMCPHQNTAPPCRLAATADLSKGRGSFACVLAPLCGAARGRDGEMGGGGE